MVLNDHKPYDTDSSDGEEDAWEMVGDETTTPLVATAQNYSTETIAAATVPDAAGDDASDNAPTESIAEREPLQLETDVLGDMNENGQDGNASFVSGVSSITGDHHHTTVSDIEDEEEEEGDDNVNNKEGGGVTTTTLVEDQEVVVQITRTPSDSPENETNASEKSETSDPLVETLSQMGFEKEQIEKAIGDLREGGAADIDADSVIGSMLGETPTSASGEGVGGGGGNPFQGVGRSAWDFVESTAQNIDNQHQLRRRTQRCAQTVGRSARDIWSNVRDESQRFRSNLIETCDQADVHARNAGTQVRYAASSAKESMRNINEEYRIAEKVATVAVVGGATLLALGNPRAGVGVMAVAGASLAAGEAMRRSSSERHWTGGPSHTGDYGLREEDAHLD